MVKLKKKTILIGAIAAVFLAALGTFYGMKLSQEKAAKQVADKTIAFINENLLSEGTTADFVSIVEENGIYKLKVKVETQEPEVYVTKNGKLLFIQGAIDMNPTSTTAGDQTNNQATSEVVKSDKPEVDLFVMSFCPFGNQAEDTMLPVYNLLKDKVNWNIHYIVSVDNNTVSSLHGQPEVAQDEREVCVLQNSGLDKWWQFTTYVNENCGSNGSCWQTAAQTAELEVSAIENCVSSQGLTLMTKEANATKEVGVSGSPTLIINGMPNKAVYQYGNSQAYLAAICSSFNNSPEECSQELSANTSTSGGGSCQ